MAERGDSLLADLRQVARGWRWTRQPVAPAEAEVPSEARRGVAGFPTGWARGPLARAVREATLAGALGPLLDASLDVAVTGREQLARVPEPVVLVANHASHLDALLVLHALPAPWRQRTVVAAASDYFFTDWWRATLAALALNAVPLQRYAGAGEQQELLRLLRTGWSVLAFPEGTRSRDGTLQRFHHGPARLALDAARPLVPVAIRGTFLAMPVGARWPRREAGARRVRLRFGSPLWPRTGERTRDLTARVRAALDLLLIEDATSWWTALRAGHAPPSAPAPSPPARWRRVWTATAPLPPGRRPPAWPVP